ncbi:MAG: CPBP family intramembrane metalloprotease [Acidobacteriota bacterium]|nr:CPBP family intramembrane metalloprotease [Acidobacteriota bacterium]
MPPPDWPPPPPDWQFWEQLGPRFEVVPDGAAGGALGWEAAFVMIAFLFPGIASAVVLVTRHAFHVGGTPSPLAQLLPGHPLANLVLGVATYFEVAAVVPLALLLLARTGQRPATIGLGRPGWSSDIWPGIGLTLAGLGGNYVVAIPFISLLQDHPGLLNPVRVGHVPAYYVVYGLTTAATTAIAEETLVNGYLLVRLEQLGWSPRTALVLSLTLRTSYHVYYGIGFLFTVPIGYFLTRSFQKHGRLDRPIVAHFLYDALLSTVAVLTS